jgi:hypothetical protein
MDMNFVFDYRRRGSRCRGFATVFRQRFAGEKNRFLGGADRSRRSTAAGAFRAAIVKGARLWATPFESAARLTTTIIVSPGFAGLRFTALRRSVLGRRQVSSTARSALRTAATTAASTPAKAPTTIATAIRTTIAAAIRATVSAAPTITAAVRSAAKSLAGAIAAGAGRIVLRRVVMRREILWSRSVGFGLTLVAWFGVGFLVRRGS